MKLLIGQKENFAAQYLKESNLLHRAAQSKKKNMIKLLIKHGADVNAKDSDGMTALHYITKEVGNVDLDIVKMFFDAGYNFTIKNTQGVAALQYYDFLAKEINIIKSFFSNKIIDKYENNYTQNLITNKILNKIEFIGAKDSNKLKEIVISDLVKLQKNKFINKIFEIVSELDFSINLFEFAIGHSNGFFEQNNCNIQIFCCTADRHDDFLSTICHELCHLAIFKHFYNNSQPFFENDEETMQHWLDFTKDCINKYPKIFKHIKIYPDSNKSKELFTFFITALAKDLLNNTNLINKTIPRDSKFMSEALKMAKNFDKSIELEDLSAGDYSDDHGKLFDLLILNELESEQGLTSDMIGNDEICWLNIGS